MLRARPYERRVATMSSATAKKLVDHCIADQFLPIGGFQNPVTTNHMDKIPDHDAHFATERPLVVKNRGSVIFKTFPFLKCRACLYEVASNRDSKLERDRSQMVYQRPGGDPRPQVASRAAGPQSSARGFSQKKKRAENTEEEEGLLKCHRGPLLRSQNTTQLFTLISLAPGKVLRGTCSAPWPPRAQRCYPAPWPCARCPRRYAGLRSEGAS